MMTFEPELATNEIRTLERFMYCSLLPLIYKYVKGMIALYIKDDSLSTVNNHIQDIYKIISEKMRIIMRFCGKNLENLVQGCMQLLLNIDDKLAEINLNSDGKAIGDDSQTNLEQDEILYTE